MRPSSAAIGQGYGRSDPSSMPIVAALGTLAYPCKRSRVDHPVRFDLAVSDSSRLIDFTSLLEPTFPEDTPSCRC